MEGQITLNEWMEWKEDIRNKLTETAQNFVHIGYRLKQIRDSGMYGGCSSVIEFAQKEYGLEKSTVCRFIAINEKFSEGGNSLYLKEEYKNFGSSKLTEMLNLSDVDCRLIVEKTTIKEIRDLKQFNAKASDKAETVPEGILGNAVNNCIVDFFADGSRRKILNESLRVLYDEDPDEDTFKKLVEFINPAEYITHKKGIVYMFFYDYQTGIKYKLMTEPSPRAISWVDFFCTLMDIYKDYIDAPEGIWEAYYGAPEIVEEKVTPIQENQEKTAVATSQPEEPKPVEKRQKKEPVKTTKVTHKEETNEKVIEEVQKTAPESVEILNNPEWELMKTAREIAQIFTNVFSDDSIGVRALEHIRTKTDELKLIVEQLIELQEEKDDNR